MQNKKLLTVLVVHQHPRVLLGMKKRGFGMGKWNGIGGKVEPDETIEAAALRELKEEIGIEVANGHIEKSGVLDFSWQGKPDILQVHFFKASHFEGEPQESEEMKPQWFHHQEIPYDTMWPDDKYWMPMLLAGKKFEGKFLFDGDNNILEHEIKEA